MSDANETIIGLAAKWYAMEAEMTGLDDVRDADSMGRLADQQNEIQRIMATLTPATAVEAIEQLDLLGESDECGTRALGVLRGLFAPALSA
jgi:hypothetical protein